MECCTALDVELQPSLETVEKIRRLQLFLVLLVVLVLVELAPRSSDAGESALPPLIEVGVGSRRRFGRLVQHGAQSAEEVRVDETASVFPLEILVVERVVLVEQVQVVGHFLRRGEIVDVNKRLLRGVLLVVDPRSSHHDRYHVTPIKFIKSNQINQRHHQSGPAIHHPPSGKASFTVLFAY